MCRNIAATECWLDWDLKGKFPIEIEIIYGRVMVMTAHKAFVV